MRKVKVRVDISDLVDGPATRNHKHRAQKVCKIVAAACDKNGKVVGRRFRLPVPSLRMLESFDDSGRPHIDIVRDRLEFDSSIAGSRRFVALKYGNREAIVPLEREQRRPDKGVIEAVPVRSGADNGWTLTVLSDCFLPSDRERFLEYCDELAVYLTSMAPFNREDVLPLISVVAWWAPTATKSGRFKCQYAEPRRVYGDPRLVKKFMRVRGYQAKANDLVIVLVDFDLPGGAGETHDNENIAWATPRVKFPAYEKWFSVAMHEIGHAFGLDDEYEVPWAGAPAKVHENVSNRSEPGELPWAYLFDEGQEPVTLRSADRALPSDHFRDFPTESEIAAFGNVAAGMFEGARYHSHGWWRSALVCKMRIASEDFCKHCANIIAQAIKGE